MKPSEKTYKAIEKALSAGQFSVAIQYLDKLLKSDPNNLSYISKRGEAHLGAENFEAGLIDYAKLVEADNTNIVSLINFAAALIRCNKQEDAKEILEFVLDLDPQNFDAHINLCNIYQGLGKPEQSLKIAFKAIELNPGSCIAYNNLGTALGDLNLIAESREAFITANMLDPTFVPTIINLVQIEMKLGNYAKGVQLYQDTLKLKNISANQTEVIKYYLSFIYLETGELGKGWDHYEYGFGPLLPKGAVRSLRKFIQPRWEGKEAKGKTLLIWREQGLGDEIEFSTCLNNLLDLDMKVIIETDPRLVSILQRTYPDFRVRPEAVGNDRLPLRNDFDLQCPIGSLPKFFRRTIDDFPQSSPVWTVDSERSAEFKKRLGPYKEKIIVGICWRSGLFSIQRNLNYTALQDWKELLTQKNIQFVNLQYGECEAELVEIEKELNISILRWPDIDLKNDLESVIALSEQLDYVVSVGTAVASLAATVGTPTFLLTHQGWMLLGEKERYPWLNCVIPLIAAPGEHVAQKIKLIPELILISRAQ